MEPVRVSAESAAEEVWNAHFSPAGADPEGCPFGSPGGRQSVGWSDEDQKVDAPICGGARNPRRLTALTRAIWSARAKVA